MDGKRVWLAKTDGVAAGSQDGQFVAVSNGLLDADTGTMVSRFAPVEQAAWFPRDRQLLVLRDGFAAVRDVKTGKDELVLVALATDKVAVFDAAGNLVRGIAEELDNEYVCCLQRDDGAWQSLKPSEFYRAMQAAK